MTPLRVSLDPKTLVRWLARILIVVAAGSIVKLLLLS